MNERELQEFKDRRGEFTATLRAASSMLRRKSSGDSRFHDAYGLMSKVIGLVEGSYAFYGDAAEREFHQYISVSSNADGNLPSYPKVRNDQFMPDFNPIQDKYRVRSKWLGFFADVIPKRAPRFFRDEMRGYVENGRHVLLAEFLGEMFAKKNYHVEVHGNVKDIYREEHFGSCMHDPNEYRGASTVSWYDKIASETGRVQIVTLRDAPGGQLVARALLWKGRPANPSNGEVEESAPEVEILDRIYPGGDAAPHVRFLIDWARERGVADHKSTQTVDGRLKGYYAVDVPADDGYPYMDTFNYGRVLDDEDGTPKTLRIFSSPPKTRPSNFAWGSLQNTSGTNPFPKIESCQDCGGRNPQGSTYSVFGPGGQTDRRRVCRRCLEDNYLAVHSGTSSWAAYEYVHSSLVTRLRTGACILTTDGQRLRNGEVVDRGDAVEQSDGTFISRDEHRENEQRRQQSELQTTTREPHVSTRASNRYPSYMNWINGANTPTLYAYHRGNNNPLAADPVVTPAYEAIMSRAISQARGRVRDMDARRATTATTDNDMEF